MSPFRVQWSSIAPRLLPRSFPFGNFSARSAQNLLERADGIGRLSKATISRLAREIVSWKHAFEKQEPKEDSLSVWCRAYRKVALGRNTALAHIRRRQGPAFGAGEKRRRRLGEHESHATAIHRGFFLPIRSCNGTSTTRRLGPIEDEGKGRKGAVEGDRREAGLAERPEDRGGGGGGIRAETRDLHVYLLAQH